MEEAAFTQVVYQRFLNQGRLMASRCRRDNELHVPPRAVCAQGHGDAMEWVELSGRGRLAAFSIIHLGTSAMSAEGYDREHPYCAAIIQLEEGPRVSALLLGVEALRPETIPIGMAVAVVFPEQGEGDGRQARLAFRPVEH